MAVKWQEMPQGENHDTADKLRCIPMDKIPKTSKYWQVLGILFTFAAENFKIIRMRKIKRKTELDKLSVLKDKNLIKVV